MSIPVFHQHTALAKGLIRLFAALEQGLGPGSSIPVYLAGGMAVHLYTGKRVTTDVDAEFGVRLLLPTDLSESTEVDGGLPVLLHFDTQYNPMFSLLHERYQDDALVLDLPLARIRLRVLQPVDLALSKVARFAAIDREDIGDLAALGLVSADALQARGDAALQDYIGNTAAVRANLADAVAIVRQRHPG
jgi:hypothetical protein